tara:strand:+ start:62023 stop:62544 length:522 start_codon:yes stop_codon:yes gene_type:complete
MTKLEEYLKQFVVQFSGLKLGVHKYEFEVVDLFFEQFNIEDVTGGQFHIDLSLEKRDNMMELIFKFNGSLSTSCDRCLDPLQIHLEGERELLVKFGETTSTENDELLVLGYEAYQLDVAPYIYEFIALNFPLRKVHNEDECNQEVINRLYPDVEEQQEDNETSNMWDKLKELK